ncbi:MAG TPA: MraY family glycosyltransferase [Tepidisphaeraceae bacterium]|nr:MraY family glycosyltransferase [Tepidisphaeraceae bacterium]
MPILLAQLQGSRAFTADEVLSPYVYVFYVAFIVSWMFTPVMRAVAVYYGIVDQPDQLRKVHTSPVAYLGGVAVFLGWVCGLASSQFLLLHRTAPPLSHVVVNLGIVAGACIILSLGLWDDLRHIKPWMKITGQVAAACTLLASGVGQNMTGQFLFPIFSKAEVYFHLPVSKNVYDTLVMVSSDALVIAIVVFCCNATNLMDGLDGLCGGVTGIIAAGFTLLAVYLGMNSSADQTNDDALRVVLSLALLGGVLGFVPYNFNPASIFMGDTGSMFLGFSCALMIILMGEVASRWFLAAMVMFALPILDTSLAFARRWVNRRPFFSADKHHFHHQLVARGMSVRRAVVVLYVLAIIFVLCGTAIVFMRTRYAGMFYMVIFCSIIVAAYKMGMVHERPAVVTRRPLDQSGSLPSPQPIESSSVLEVRDDRNQKSSSRS